LDSVLDISKKEIQETLATTLQEIKAPWRLSQARGELVPTQTFGQAVFDSGRYQAIRYPSAKVPDKTCIVIFIERLNPPSFIEIYDPHGNLKERIPRDTE
jgi:RES domain-containing protein